MNSKTNNKYEHLLNNQFGSTVMYYYTFDTRMKNMETINDFITKFDGVYKLIFEVIISNKKVKLDYDIESNKELLKKPEYIISKLFVIKRSETKSNMVYFDINKFMIQHLKFNPNLTKINVDIMASVKQYDEYDSNVNMLLISNIAPRIIRLNSVVLSIDKTNSSDTLFVTLETDESKSVSPLFKKIKIVGNSLFVVPTIELIKNKISELSDSLYGDLNDSKSLYVTRAIQVLTDIISTPDELDKISLEYKLQSFFFS